jgi:hypothetical protein
MDRKIITTRARLGDEAEMAKFLSPIPNGENPVSTRAYQDETRTARFVESDGDVVMCFAIDDLTIDQAEMIEIEWEGICALDESLFQKAVQQALDGSFRRAK